MKDDLVALFTLKGELVALAKAEMSTGRSSNHRLVLQLLLSEL